MLSNYRKRCRNAKMAPIELVNSEYETVTKIKLGYRKIMKIS